MELLKHQVFLCFRGEDVRVGFLSFLVAALKRKSVNYYVDYEEMRGEVTSIFLQRIAECRVVLVIFSQNFMDSKWCTNEVLKAMKTRGPGKTIIPIFYKVSVEEVKKNWRDFLKEERDKWSTITDYLGLVYTGKAVSESDFVDKIVEDVERTLSILETKEKEDKSSKGEEKKQKITITINTWPFFGIKKRVQQLKHKLKMDCYEETRVVGVVGIKGIGKTKLAEMLFEETQGEFERPVFFKNQIRKKMENGKKLDLLLKLFLQSILKKKEMITDKTTHEDVKKQLLETIHLLVLDDFSSKEEIVHILGDRGWIKEGSKIVIVTNDKSLVEGLVDDTYVVPGLNEKEGLKCLTHHAFRDATWPTSDEENILKLTRKFVDYAGGNPSALKLLGKELWGKNVGEWESILNTLDKSPNKDIQDLLNLCYDDLTELQQDAFLDITCFFRSHDHKFVQTMVDSSCAAGDRSIIKDLADKFLIDISSGRIEMNDLLYKLGKNLALQDHNLRLCNQQDIINVLEKKLVSPECVRGIFLDICEVTEKRPLRNEAFVDMRKLRYLKFYSSCTSVRESVCNLTIRNGLKFSLEEVRYFHWLNFPLKELPRDFEPKNLIDLKLPYSDIKRLWAGHKDITKLKWVDLNHSVNLEDLSGLLGAQNLERLNLEGCTKLTRLEENTMETMTSLVYLNLRSCTSLVSLPETNIKSLKSLILSDCSNLGNFKMISENLEALYLDGTALTGLPETTKNLKKLIILSMKGCKMLESLPESLGRLQTLQEVILSSCSKLQSFPDIIKNIRILLLDGTAIRKAPQVIPFGKNGLSLLRRLCMSGNDVIQTLEAHICQLYHLKCLDLYDCKNLISIPTLPPNLQCLDAHGCDLLTTVANPLAFLNLTDYQIHSTFIFSNCKNLYEAAKSCIISYIQKKCQLMSSALNRYILDSVMEPYTGACFPGCEVPEWFSHKAYGSEIETDLVRHRSENQIIGVALCAAVSFEEYQGDFSVKCTCEFKNANGTLIKRFSCTVGGSNGPGIEPRKFDSDHVFVCYKSLLEIKKQSEAEDKKLCSSYKASLKFEVIDGSCELVKGEVFKCGFSMVYELAGSDHDNVSWKVTSIDGPDGYESNHDDDDDESMSSATQEPDEISIDEQESNDDYGQQEEEIVNANLETENDSDQNMDDEVTPRLFLLGASTEIQVEDFNSGAKLEAAPIMQKPDPHLTRGRAENKQGTNAIFSHGEGDTTCFSFFQIIIPCLRRKHLEIKSHGQVQEAYI